MLIFLLFFYFSVLIFSSMAFHKTENMSPCIPLAMIFVFRPRPNSPDSPSVLMTSRTACTYVTPSVCDCFRLLSTIVDVVVVNHCWLLKTVVDVVLLPCFHHHLKSPSFVLFETRDKERERDRTKNKKQKTSEKWLLYGRTTTDTFIAARILFFNLPPCTRPFCTARVVVDYKGVSFMPWGFHRETRVGSDQQCRCAPFFFVVSFARSLAYHQ